MKKETLVIIGEAIGEALIGASLGLAMSEALTKTNKLGKAILVVGGALTAFTVGRSFGKEVFELSNEHWGTDIIVR
jgi:hypothetical protein